MYYFVANICFFIQPFGTQGSHPYDMHDAAHHLIQLADGTVDRGGLLEVTRCIWAYYYVEPWFKNPT